MALCVIPKLRAGGATRQVSSIRSDFGFVRGVHRPADRSAAAMTPRLRNDGSPWPKNWASTPAHAPASFTNNCSPRAADWSRAPVSRAAGDAYQRAFWVREVTNDEAVR